MGRIIISIITFISFEALAELTINVEVKRDNVTKEKVMDAYLVIMEPSKDLFSLTKKMGDGFVKGSLPHYHNIGRTEEKMSKQIELQKGSYKAQVFLKEDSSDCDISKEGVPRGSCFPMEKDILCSAVTFDITSKEEDTVQKIQCEVGSNV